jgi:hypothetical protein
MDTQKTAFTPGPWDVFERPDPKRYSDPVGASFVHCGPSASDDTGFDLVARVYTRDGLDERQANARLIAAAPCQHKALEDLLEHYTRLVNCGDCGLWDPETEPEVIAARVALARAKGDAA